MERIPRRRLIEAGIVLAGAVGVIGAVRGTVEVLEEFLKPRYILRGNPPPPIDEPAVWQPLTKWERTTAPNSRVTFTDGRLK